MKDNRKSAWMLFGVLACAQALTAGDKGDDALLMLIRRGKTNFFVTLKKGKEEKK